jgi:hypothetical protein
MGFSEDNSLEKRDNSAVNFNVVTKVALALLEKEQSKNASKTEEDEMRLSMIVSDRKS